MAVTIITKQATNAENLDNGITGSLPWLNPLQALVSDNNYASVDFGDSEESYGISQYLYLNTFETDLPDTAVVNGIIAAVERKGVGTTEDHYVGLVYDNGEELIVTSPGKQKTGTWPTSDLTAYYGDSTDKWNHTWLPSELNSASFGLAISSEGDVAQHDAGLIDHIELTLYWHQEITPEISGGGSCSGSADVYMPTAGAHGRVQVSGVAQVDCRFRLKETVSGGSFVYGSSIAHDFINPVGGSTVYGLHIYDFTYNPPHSGGGIIGGEAYVQFNDVVHVGGGVIAHGSSIAHDFINPVGGSTVGGEIVFDWTYNHVPNGGVLIDPVIFINPQWMDGGTQAGGTATVEATYDLDDVGGMIFLSGKSVTEINIPVEGGITTSGSSTSWPTFIPPLSGEGISTSGISFVDPYMPLGGAVLPTSAGESAKITPYWYPVETTNALVGGEAVNTMVYSSELGPYQWTIFPNSGEPTIEQDYVQNGWAYLWLHPETNEFGWDIRFGFEPRANAIRIRGPADFGENNDAIFKIEQLSGGTSPSIGSTTITESQKADLIAGLWYVWIISPDDEQLRGQITKYQTGVSAIGSTQITHLAIPEGGSVAGGAADMYVDYKPVTPFIGVKTLGDGEHSIVPSLEGGISVAGSASIDCQYDIDIDGGVVLEGNATETIAYLVLASGGSIVDGSGIIGIAPQIGGMIYIGPQHIRSYTAGTSMTGGVTVVPLHRQTFTDFYIAYGSVRVGGKGKRENIRYFPPRKHLGYCRAMSSENICTAITYDKELLPPTNETSPELSPTRFRIQHNPGWCEVEDRCEEGVLPEVIQKRQKGIVPPKIRSDTARDRGIATATLVDAL